MKVFSEITHVGSKLVSEPSVFSYGHSPDVLHQTMWLCWLPPGTQHLRQGEENWRGAVVCRALHSRRSRDRSEKHNISLCQALCNPSFTFSSQSYVALPHLSLEGELTFSLIRLFSIMEIKQKLEPLPFYTVEILLQKSKRNLRRANLIFECPCQNPK